MKRIVFTILVIIVIITMLSISVGAIPACHYYGDVNNDTSVDILDATEIQRYLAQITELSKLEIELADVDADEKVSVIDATMIQRKLAGLINSFEHNKEGLFTYVDINNLTSNFDSGVAMVGVPVTFNVEAYSPDAGPLRYQYVIFETGNDMPLFVSEIVDNSVFTYTFEEATDYIVCINVHNKYDEIEQYEFEYQVAEQTSDALIISAINKNKLHLNEYEDIIIFADAFGGTQPYEYHFILNGSDVEQDYSEINSFEIGALSIGEYTVTVTVKDADGNTDSKDYCFEIEEVIPG